MASVGYSKAVVAAVQLALVPLLAHAWGLALYGQWLMLTAAPAFLLAADAGFGVAAGNTVIAQVARGQHAAALETFHSALAAVHCTSLSVLVVAWIGCGAVPAAVLELVGGLPAVEARRVLAVLCLWGVVSAQGGLFMAVTRSAGGFARSGALDASVQLGEGAAALVTVLLGGGPLAVAVAWLAVRSLGLGGQVVLARREAEWLRLGYRQARGGRLHALWRPALAAMVLPLAQAGYLQGTALAVGAAAGAAAVPVFTALRTLSRAGSQLLMVFNLPLLPDYTAAQARGNRAWLARMTARIVQFNLGVGVTGGIVLALCGPAMLEWWTAGAIRPPALMVRLSAAGLVLAALWQPLSNLLVATNRHVGFACAFVSTAAAAIMATGALVPRWGLAGAALAGVGLDGMMLAVVARGVWHLTARE